ncbi:MAG: glycosyltransferase family 9 protein, partial [Planctomycetia bacterium]|nr:glycosyltransferase family 9 protein [Planctomycetia bacterium]
PSVKPPPRRILVILLSELGSLVLSEPMLCRLQKRYPDATLYMLLFARNRQVLDLLSFVQPEHILAVRDDSALHLLIDLWHSIRRMRTIGIDTVIDCELFARCSAIISGCSGALRRIGFHRHAQEGLYRGSFHTSPVPYNPYRHLSLQLISLADAIESGETPRAKSDLVTGPFAPPTFVPGLGEVKREMDQLYGRMDARLA